MSCSQPAPQTMQPPGPSGGTQRGGAGLLGLVQRLIEYGRTLVDTLQQRNTTEPPTDVAERFGSASLTLIIARITRGLWLAGALERRIARAEARPDASARRDTPDPATQDRPTQDRPIEVRPIEVRPRTTRRKPEDEAAELANLPSARDIAARVRGRPIGAVIGDICRDLGIDGTHPLWAEVLDAITAHGGNLARMVNVVQRRSAERIRAALIALVPDMVSRFDGVHAALWPATWATPPP